MSETNNPSSDFSAHMASKKAAEKKAGKSKFKNKWIEVDGIRFQSESEGRYYLTCKSEKESGKIKDFERQRRYKLIVNGIQVSAYRADFVKIFPDGSEQIIDVKSIFTRKNNDYIIRKKLMKALFKIEIMEV